VPVVSMSKQEFKRLEWLLGVQAGRLRVTDACGLILDPALGDCLPRPNRRNPAGMEDAKSEFVGHPS